MKDSGLYKKLGELVRSLGFRRNAVLVENTAAETAETEDDLPGDSDEWDDDE